MEEENNRNVVLVVKCGGGGGSGVKIKKMARSEIPEEKDSGGRGLV